MRVVRLADEIDFSGWRVAARQLRGEGVAPDEVLWTVDAEADLLDPAPRPTAATFTVPRGFLDLAKRAVLHRSPERFALLYRLVWRAADPADPDLAKVRVMAREVEAAAAKMRDDLAFTRLEDPPETHVAWFAPAHRVTEPVTQLLVRRFGAERFSILTPDVCAYWDGAALRFTPGVDPADAPAPDGLEAYWRGRYAGLFGRGNPALGRAIAERTAAGPRTAMADRPPLEPSRRALGDARRLARDAPYDGRAPETLDELAAGVDACRRCPLWRDATQAVAGEGPGRARLMLVGEQPGDQEDLAGRPFVGPAGQVLDKALAAAGIGRAETYVTNAVKHFKHEPRGKRRLHKTPNAGEVAACRWWLEAERRIVRPRVIVALGATAALGIFGKPTAIGPLRGQALQLPDQAQGVVTYHPSYLLRVPDAETKAQAFEDFVEDLKFARRLAG